MTFSQAYWTTSVTREYYSKCTPSVEGLTDLIDEEGAVRLGRAGAGQVGCGRVIALEERVRAAGFERLDQLRNAESRVRLEWSTTFAWRGQTRSRSLH